MLDFFASFFADKSTLDLIWIGIGFLGQAMFSARFLIQWIASERVRRSIVPTTFWYFSIAGGIILLSYALYNRDIVIVVGQSMGLLIYARNLYFIHFGKKDEEGE